MKHFAFSFFVLILLLAGCKDDVPSAYVEKTPGGVEYARLYIPQAETTVIQIAWASDWAIRENVNQAAPYIGADLIIAGGAEGYPAGEAAETFADLQIDGGLWITPDHILGRLIASEENLAKAAKIANAHLRAPMMDQDWFERIRDGFAAGLTEAAAQPANKGFDALRWAVLGDVPLRRALSIDAKEVAAVTREDVIKWQQENLVSDRAKIVVAGPVDAKIAGSAVDMLFAGLPEGKTGHSSPPEPDFTPRRILFHQPDARTSTLAFIAPMPPTQEGGEFEDIILADALGGSEQSVLFDAVRTKLRASYGFGAVFDGYMRQFRILALVGDVETAKLAQAETVVKKAYADFRITGPSGNLADRKAPFAINGEQTANDPVTAAFSALMALLDGEDPGMALHLKSALDKVSEETLKQRLTESFPTSDDFVVLAVSSDANALPGACVITLPEQAVDCR